MAAWRVVGFGGRAPEARPAQGGGDSGAEPPPGRGRVVGVRAEPDGVSGCPVGCGGGSGGGARQSIS